MRNLPKVAQLVSDRAMIHTQICLAQQPVFSMSRDQNIAKFFSQRLMMAHFTLNSHLDSLRREVADLVIPQ